MGMPPQFPAQRQFEEFLEQYKAEQKQQQENVRKQFEDLREERKIGLQKWSILVASLALVVSLGSGAWNASVAYRSFAVARRGFVAVRLIEVSADGTQMTFEVKATPPNPALHVQVRAVCGTYVENGREPDKVLTEFHTYEENITLAPGDSKTYVCEAGTGEGMHAPHGRIQKALRGTVTYSDLAGNRYFTDFCFRRHGSGEFFTNDFIACPNSNDAN